VDEKILPSGLLIWLAVAGVIMGGTSLGVIWWASDAHDAAVARTMGLTTFSIANVFLAFSVKDATRSILDFGETFTDKRLLLAAGLSAVAIVFGTELRICQRFLHTVSLSGSEWVVCILGALTVVVAFELRKAWLRHRREPAPVPQTA
jgi:P-type Ca2+ transporter type 2C